VRRHLPTRHESPAVIATWRITWAGTRVENRLTDFRLALSARRALRPPAPTMEQPPLESRRRLVIAVASN